MQEARVLMMLHLGGALLNRSLIYKATYLHSNSCSCHIKWIRAQDLKMQVNLRSMLIR